MSTLNKVIANGYHAWGHVPYYYNDYNVMGSDPTCKHPTWTDNHGGTTQPIINRYCDSCGYRKLFIKYAKYCRTSKKGKK